MLLLVKKPLFSTALGLGLQTAAMAPSFSSSG